jgi:hypothetical protein
MAQAELDELRVVVAQQKRVIDVLAQQVGKLLGEAANLTKKPNGKAKTKPPPRSSGEPGSSEPPPKPPAASERKASEKLPGVPRRGPLSADLPRNVDEQPLPAITCCATPLLEARDPLIREQRDFVPATVRVQQIKLHRAECLCCGAVHTAPMPPVAMPNGSMTAALLAFVVYGKCGRCTSR